MKNGLLICSGSGMHKNIGDYIQSLAGEQYFNQIDCFVERESLNSFKSSQVTNVIMNGWFMWNPSNWPPSDSINPLFVSFHLVPEVANIVLSDEGVKYLKKYEPIGCRDFNTSKLLEQKGIKTYFSGCLTLCLGKKYKYEGKREGIIFVDPYYETIKNKNGDFSLKLLIKNFFYGIFHLSKIQHLWKNINYERGMERLDRKFPKVYKFLNCAAFYKSYSKMFSDSVLFNSEFYSHSVMQCLYKTDIEKLNYAKELVNRYARAKYVITSRIHCALPCLGIETPVIFITSENLESEKKPIRSPGRFGGLKELFHVMAYSQNKVFSSEEIFNKGKLDEKFIFENKDDYKILAKKLDQVCENFVSTGGNL